MKFTKSIMVFLFGIISLVSFSSTSSAQEISRSIINTTWNAYQPNGQMIQIKNVDLVEIQTRYLDFVDYKYELRIYLWLQPMIGYKSNDVSVINKDVPDQKSNLPVQRVGSDRIDNQTYNVYEAVFPLKNKNFEVFLYAILRYNEQNYFSNEKNPNTFFRVAY